MIKQALIDTNLQIIRKKYNMMLLYEVYSISRQYTRHVNISYLSKDSQANFIYLTYRLYWSFLFIVFCIIQYFC